MSDRTTGSWALGRTLTEISRAEHGYLRLSEVDVIFYLAFCGVHGRKGADLRARCREAEPNPATGSALRLACRPGKRLRPKASQCG